MTTISIPLGGDDHELDLQLPRSMAAVYDVLEAGSRNRTRAFAAALGLCWPPAPPRPRHSTREQRAEHKRLARLLRPPAALYQGDPLEYGGAVFDDLYARGMLPAEIVAAGVQAFNLVAEQIVLEREVEAAEGNSEALEGS